MADVGLKISIRWPWWRKPFMWVLLAAARIGVPVSAEWASKVLVHHAVFEAA